MIIGLDFSAGFSICLRLSYKFLVSSYIFETEQVALVMLHYKSKIGGSLNVDDIYFNLPWPGQSKKMVGQRSGNFIRIRGFII